MTDYLVTKEFIEQEIEKLKGLMSKDISLMSHSKVNEINLAIQYEAEKLSSAARLLPTYYDNNEKIRRLVEDNIKEVLGIEYHYDKETNVFSAIIPALLPKKEASKQSAKWIRASVQSTLRDFISKNALNPLDGEFFAIFEHIYSSEERKMRDHDRIECSDGFYSFILVA